MRRFGLGCWWVGTVLALIGVPLAVMPGLSLVPGQGLGAWLPTWLVLGASQPVEAPKVVTLLWAAAFLLVGLGLRARAVCGPWGRWALGLSVALLAWLGIAVLLSSLPGWGLLPWLQACSALVLAVAWGVTSTEADRATMKSFLTATAGVVALYGISQRMGWDPLSWFHPPWFNRTPSTMGNPDFTAHFDVTVLPLVWQPGVKARRPLSLAVMAAVLVDLCICEARGSVLALMVALVYWWVRTRRAKASPRWLAAVLVLTVAATLNVLILRAVNPGEDSGTARVYLWRVSARLIRQHPWLGCGLGLFPYAMLPHRDLEPVPLRHRTALAEDPHDIVFSTGVAGGLPAVGLLLILVLAGVGQAWKEPRDAGAEACLVAYGINLLSLFPTPETTVAAALAAACLWPPPADGAAPPRPGTVAVTVPLLLLSLVFGVSTLRAECLGKQAWEWAQSHQVERGEAPARAALESPLVPPPWRAQLVDERARALAEAFAGSRLTAQALEAVALFQVEIGMNPLDPYPAMEAGRLAEELGVIDAAWRDKALALETRAVTLDPFNPNFHKARGILYLRLGRIREAVDDLQASVDLYPHDADAWTWLSKAREKLGDRAGALQDVRRALDEDRSYGPATEQLNTLMISGQSRP